jgi:hypothetical protein
LLEGCKKLKEKDIDCNEFLKAFHRYVWSETVSKWDVSKWKLLLYIFLFK